MSNPDRNVSSPDTRDILHPAASWGPAAWKALTLLYKYADESRPDGQYQGGMWRGELKRETGIDDDHYALLIHYGQIAERAANFQTDDPDEAWGVEITPRGRLTVEFGRMHTFLSSIATAQPQSEQAEWMVETAREGLRVGE